MSCDQPSDCMDHLCLYLLGIFFFPEKEVAYYRKIIYNNYMGYFRLKQHINVSFFKHCTLFF